MKDYLAIEKIRFGEKLSMNLTLVKSVRSFLFLR